VRACLDEAFRRYGLPGAMLCDNGGPWGARGEYTELAVYLMRLGIRLLHGRALHPQTQGKIERFHRTLETEAVQGRNLADLEECQRVFDAWRRVYNAERPHEALGMATPASRYRPSAVALPAVLPAVEYPAGYEVRKVQHGGFVSLHGRDFRVGTGLKGQFVGLRYLDEDGLVEARFVNTVVRTVDLRQNEDRAAGDEA
jgi:hypothetical protein